jgi:hypothetical protein
VDKDIRAIVAPDEAVTLPVVEPLDRAFHELSVALSRVQYSDDCLDGRQQASAFSAEIIYLARISFTNVISPTIANTRQKA